MIIQKSSIAPKLSRLKTIIPSKSTVESIQGILYKNKTLAATNLDISIQTQLDNDSNETFIIPTRAIDLIESLPDEEIEIIPEENNSIKIKTRHINNKFQSYDPATFPTIEEELKTIASGKIEGKELEKGIKSVLYAVREYIGKQMLGGVYFDSLGGKLNIVGCDGYRMSWNRIECANEFNFIVPKLTIQKLLSVGMNGEVEIQYKQSKATFITDEYTIHTGLIESNYIKYSDMLSKQENKITVDRVTVTEAVKRCMLCSTDKNKAVIKIKINKDNITISTNSDTAEYIEEIKAENSIDKDIIAGINGAYFMDFLRSFEDEKIELNFPPNVLTAESASQSALVVLVKI